MNTQASTDAAGHRGFLIGVASGAVMLGALSWFTPSTPPAQSAATRVATPIDQWDARPTSEREQADGQESNSEGPVRPAAAAVSAPGEARPPVTSSLRFLGRMNTGSETNFVLFGSGRSIKVRGLGPVDGSEYVVDDLQDSFLVIRNTRLGTSQSVEFTPPVQAPPNWSPEDSPQD